MNSEKTIGLILGFAGFVLVSGCAALILDDLSLAARGGDLARVKKVVESDPGCVRRQNTTGNTALINAAGAGQVEVVRFLISHGADVNAHCVMSGYASLTPLLVAAMDGRVEMARVLIEGGAEVNPSPNQMAPLFGAAMAGSLDGVELLLSKGANVNAVIQSQEMPGWTPLHVAVNYNHAPIVDILLSKGADINSRAANGHTPLRIALLNKNSALASTLRGRGAAE